GAAQLALERRGRDAPRRYRADLAGRRARRRRQFRGQRRGDRHPRGDPRQHLRPVLFDQGDRQGHRAGAVDLLRHRARSWWWYPAGVPGGTRHHLSRDPAARRQGQGPPRPRARRSPTLITSSLGEAAAPPIDNRTRVSMSRGRIPPVKDTYSTHDVAKICCVTPTAVIRWIEDGLIPAFKTVGGHRRVRREDLEKVCRDRNIPFNVPTGTEVGRILVIDDEPVVLELVRDVLKELSHKFEVEVAKDAFDAGRLVVSFRPQLIFLD